MPTYFERRLKYILENEFDDLLKDTSFPKERDEFGNSDKIIRLIEYLNINHIIPRKEQMRRPYGLGLGTRLALLIPTRGDVSDTIYDRFPFVTLFDEYEGLFYIYTSYAHQGKYIRLLYHHKEGVWIPEEPIPNDLRRQLTDPDDLVFKEHWQDHFGESLEQKPYDPKDYQYQDYLTDEPVHDDKDEFGCPYNDMFKEILDILERLPEKPEDPIKISLRHHPRNATYEIKWNGVHLIASLTYKRIFFPQDTWTHFEETLDKIAIGLDRRAGRNPGFRFDYWAKEITDVFADQWDNFNDYDTPDGIYQESAEYDDLLSDEPVPNQPDKFGHFIQDYLIGGMRGPIYDDTAIMNIGCFDPELDPEQHEFYVEFNPLTEKQAWERIFKVWTAEGFELDLKALPGNYFATIDHMIDNLFDDKTAWVRLPRS